MTPGGCSSCTGQRVDNCLIHTRDCSFYYPRSAPTWTVRDVVFHHPDVCELDAYIGFWYPDLPEEMSRRG